MRRLMQIYGVIRRIRYALVFLLAVLLFTCPIVSTIWAVCWVVILPMVAMEEDPDQDRIRHLIHFQALSILCYLTSLGALAMSRYFFGWFDGITVPSLAGVLGALYGIGLLAHIATAIPAFEHMYSRYKHYKGDI